jgi:voltage-gated sodium channel
MYVYAIIGFYKFGHIDLENWGNLGRAFRSLFQILTLDGWAELQRPVASVLPWSWLFFYSYTIIAVFVVVNLFIAVVINNLDQVQRESRAAAAAADGAESRKAQLESMRSLIQQLSDRIDSLERN